MLTTRKQSFSMAFVQAQARVQRFRREPYSVKVLQCALLNLSWLARLHLMSSVELRTPLSCDVRQFVAQSAS